MGRLLEHASQRCLAFTPLFHSTSSGLCLRVHCEPRPGAGRPQAGVLPAPPQQTVQDIALGRPYNLYTYTTLKDKTDLLDAALDRNVKYLILLVGRFLLLF